MRYWTLILAAGAGFVFTSCDGGSNDKKIDELEQRVVALEEQNDKLEGLYLLSEELEGYYKSSKDKKASKQEEKAAIASMDSKELAQEYFNTLKSVVNMELEKELLPRFSEREKMPLAERTLIEEKENQLISGFVSQRSDLRDLEKELRKADERDGTNYWMPLKNFEGEYEERFKAFERKNGPTVLFNEDQKKARKAEAAELLEVFKEYDKNDFESALKIGRDLSND